MVLQGEGSLSPCGDPGCTLCPLTWGFAHLESDSLPAGCLKTALDTSRAWKPVGTEENPSCSLENLFRRGSEVLGSGGLVLSFGFLGEKGLDTSVRNTKNETQMGPSS